MSSFVILKGLPDQPVDLRPLFLSAKPSNQPVFPVLTGSYSAGTEDLVKAGLLSEANGEEAASTMEDAR